MGATASHTPPAGVRDRRSLAGGDAPTSGGELVDAHRAGDEQALPALMDSFGRMMRCVARRYLVANGDIEDAVQDAWVAFVRSAHQIVDADAVGGWLRVTTAHAAIAIAKRQDRCRALAVAPDDLAGSDETDAALVDEREIRAVRDAVSRLRPEHRELIGLLFSDRLSYVEIGARTGRPVGWIGPTRERAIARLRADRSIQQLGTRRAS